MALLVASQIACEKNDRVLFQGLDLSVQSGELVFLKGENGAGKTSLLRILVGLSTPNSGTVALCGLDIHQDTAYASHALLYCGHKAGHSTLLNAYENLRFFCDLRGIENVPKADILSLLSTLQLDGLEDLPLKHLSAGQQRRVSLAKLFLDNHAKLWILDEPFTSLDANTVNLIENKILTFLHAGGAVIMTSHQHCALEKYARTLELEYNW